MPRLSLVIFSFHTIQIHYDSQPYRLGLIFASLHGSQIQSQGGTRHPALIVEAGFNESYNDLFDDMRRLPIGGDGDIKVVIIVK
ncbi:uncharacterized protein N7496_001469 [Penicillium cataractarum]|uniref:Uncharacterized protein n=1 Tax=Penicillium cataractarum TaxID=2100454 RepID=A0A9W9VW10_9EURO|nr:uncharacterized protein N7496_001469 [Penicillium cataractarum]KAJ5390401.1 hypothetical protein N7496_001469 [Penicillium cataractarum]